MGYVLLPDDYTGNMMSVNTNTMIEQVEHCLQQLCHSYIVNMLGHVPDYPFSDVQSLLI